MGLKYKLSTGLLRGGWGVGPLSSKRLLKNSFFFTTPLKYTIKTTMLLLLIIFLEELHYTHNWTKLSRVAPFWCLGSSALVWDQKTVGSLVVALGPSRVGWESGPSSRGATKGSPFATKGHPLPDTPLTTSCQEPMVGNCLAVILVRKSAIGMI